MPKVKFIPDNKVQSREDFPRLKLAMNESARIVVLEDANMAWVHTLRAPTIGPDGKAITHMIDKRNGDQVEAFKQDFIGRPICLGDLETLDERGVDPTNCPACAESVSSSAVNAPERRFAVHVAKYATKPGTFELTKPFNAQIVVWAFTEGRFNTITDFQTEWGPLQQHDLKLGPCTHADFQKFEINIAADAEWLKTKATQDYIKEALAENQAKDLDAFCGRKVDRKFMELDIETIKKRWAIANGQEAAENASSNKADLNGLLSGKKKEAAPAPDTDVADAVDTTAEAVSDDDAADTTAAPPSLDFNALLGQLKSS